jgi:hypothetical protein
LRKLRASVVDRLSVVTRINANIHIVDVVLELYPTECGKVVSVTGSNETRVAFAPFSADPPQERSGSLYVSGQISSGFRDSSVRDNLDSVLLGLLIFPRFREHPVDESLQPHHRAFCFQECDSKISPSTFAVWGVKRGEVVRPYAREAGFILRDPLAMS